MAFTHSATAEHKELLDRLSKLVEGSKITHYNIPQHRVEDHIVSGSVALTFGTFATAAATQYVEDKQVSNVMVIELPHFKYLTPLQGNKDKRQFAYDALVELNNFLKQEAFLPAEIHVTKEDLPDLDRYHLAMLSKMTEQNNKDTCFQISKNGKLIEIGFKPKPSKADVFLTFEEVYTIRSLMDVMGVKEVDLVRDNKNTGN